MKLLPCGEHAFLIEFASLDEVLVADALIRAQLATDQLPWRGIIDVIPAARTLLVTTRWATQQIAAAVLAELGELSSVALPAPSREVTIAVDYCGADLAEVAAATGLSQTEVIEAHTTTPWRVAFSGFAPGFAYLVGGDPRLRVPRKTTPRPKVPAGAVALADQFSGIYPTSSPGGWQLIGHTDAMLFDPTADPPALLSPGTVVHFRQASCGPAPVAPAVPSIESARGLWVVRAQLPLLIQDAGREGQAAIGVSGSGAADREAYRRGADLVGNYAGEAALEIVFGSVQLRAEGTLTVALTGAPCPAWVGERQVTTDESFTVGDGELLTLAAPTHGLRTYLSVRGGIAAPTVLGSRASDTLGGLGPAPVQVGERIAIAESYSGWLPQPTTLWQPPPADEAATLYFTPGPRHDWVSGLDQSQWQVSAHSNRVGLRLEGVPLERLAGELPSEGVVRGAIQVPPSGQPVIFLADHPLTGGYPVAGVLTAESVDAAAQLRPGESVTLIGVGSSYDQ